MKIAGPGATKQLISWVLAVCSLLFYHHLHAQNRIPATVLALEKSGVSFEMLHPFTDTRPATHLDIPIALSAEAHGLIPSLHILSIVADQKPEHMEVVLPGLDGSNIRVRVYREQTFTNTMRVRYSDGRVEDTVEGAFYRGMVVDQPQSLVALSFYRDHVRGFVSTPDGNFVLGPLEPGDVQHTHIFYNDRTIAHLFDWQCSTDEVLNQAPLFPEIKPSGRASECVAMYWEVNHDIYLAKFNSTNDYITGMTNEVYTLFDNDGITLETNEIFIWVTPSPYSGPSSSQFLEQFRNQHNGNFNGDLGHLVSFSGSGGVAYLDGLCNPPFNAAFSSIESNYQNVPTYSWTIMVCAHEIGHNLGSPHTHACAWNGNDTRIDNCGGNAGLPEGNCNSDPPNPPNGGTIMSYCHLIPGVGINFNEGFGPQPSALMLDRIDNAQCLVGCGNTPPCAFTLQCPGTFTIQCDADFDPWVTGQPIIVFNGICENDPSVAWLDDISGLNGCNGTGPILRTFTATEGGHTATCSQTINIVDQTPPVLLYIGPDITLSCQEEIPDPEIEAYDNCGVPTIQVVEWMQPGNCDNRFTLTRTYDVRDACGNKTTGTQIITVVDNSPPTFDAGNSNSYVYECHEVIPVIEPLVFDSCSVISLDYEDVVVTQGGCPPLLFRRIWTAGDDCGNTSTFEVFIEKRDAEAPVAKCRPISIHLDADTVWIDLELLDDGSFDNCTSVSLHSQPEWVSCEELGPQQVLLIAEDACGNKDTCTSTLSVTADTAFAFFTVEDLGGGQFTFDAAGSSGDSFFWDFGDEEKGDGEQVEHTYDQPGSFRVELIVTDSLCGLKDTMFVWIDSGVTGVSFTVDNRLEVFPNPSSGQVHVRLSGYDPDVRSVTVYNMLGQVIHFVLLESLTAAEETIVLDLSHKPQGLYRLQVRSRQGDFYSTLMLTK